MSIPCVEAFGRSSPLTCLTVSVDVYDSLTFVCIESTPSVADLDQASSVDASGSTPGDVLQLLAMSVWHQPLAASAVGWLLAMLAQGRPPAVSVVGRLIAPLPHSVTDIPAIVELDRLKHSSIYLGCGSLRKSRVSSVWHSSFLGPLLLP